MSKFVLEMKGGSKSLLQNSTNLCARPQRALAKLTAQNGKVSDTEPLLRVKCPKGRRGKGHSGQRHRRAG